MPTMSMNKVIHAAFRRDLDRFVGALDDLPRRGHGACRRARPGLGQLRRPADHTTTRGSTRSPGRTSSGPGVARDAARPDGCRARGDGRGAGRRARGDERPAPETLRTTGPRAATRGRWSTCGPPPSPTSTTRRPSSRRSTSTHADHPEIKAMGREFRKQSPAVGRPVLRVGHRRRVTRGARGAP